ncbi:MAG: sodium/solute symporter, partial [Saprospiraceae bacterium]|nr:sodium/solute symporter [Saprospiraceae bacterium]
AQEKWIEFPPLPDSEGFAGMYAGVSNEVLLCAGGANFPDQKPWEGGSKQWYDHIYFLENADDQWKIAEQTLPWARAYGVSVAYLDQVILIGGSDGQGHYNEVIGISFQNGQIEIDQGFPSLPITLANMCGTIIDGVIYIAGGNEHMDSLATQDFYMLDLKVGVSERIWKEGPSWPGPSRMQSVAASHEGMFYLMSGFTLTRDAEKQISRTLLTDAYRYTPSAKNTNGGIWTKLPDMPRGTAAAPSPAFTIGMSHILIPGGLDAETLKNVNPQDHPGFSEATIAFNTHSTSWVAMGDMPRGSSRVTAPTAYFHNKWMIINGERAPGIRSPEIYTYETGISFGMVNWITLVSYLLMMLLMGFYFSKRGNSTNDYFLGGGRIPWWAAGISIYGTQLSAITFMAIPAIVYATDWRLAIGTMMILAIVPFIVKYYLPSFRKFKITTAYEFLESRFDLKVRWLGSLTFILLQLGRMGVVLYLPAIAIASVTSIDLILCIAVMGVFATAYTVMGGIEAVIWTDVVQVVVLMGGAIACIFVAIFNIDGGADEIIRIGIEHNKFLLLDWRWDYTDLVFWVAIIGFFFLNLISYSSDQVIIQRYLTVKTEKEAANSLWTNGLITIPGIFVFFGLGTALYVFYLSNPAEISSSTPDEILPYFVVAELPAGVAGLVISGLFAASMSSLDSSMNSIATAYITDFHKQIWPGSTDRQYLRLARFVTILMGIFGTITAMWIAVSSVGFIFDFFQEILGMIGGSLAGVFALAVFFKRANAWGAVAGTIGGAMVTLIAKNTTDINGYLYGAVGVVSCVLIGLIVSSIFSNTDDENEWDKVI